MPSTQDALELVGTILDLIEDEVPDWAKEKASDFFEDVEEKVREVGKTIEARGMCTERQYNALQGWERGVRGWIKD